MKQLPENFDQALMTLITRLNNYQYAVRGTTSLILHGLDMGLDDIDVLCNKETAFKVNSLFAKEIIKKVALSESSQFKSFYGAAKIAGVQIEFMGDWQIKDKKGNWCEPFKAAGSEIEIVTYKERQLPVTTIKTELKMFTLMGRWNALYKIKKQLRPALL